MKHKNQPQAAPPPPPPPRRMLLPGSLQAAAAIGAEVSVLMDGDTDTITAVNAVGISLSTGARVLVDFVPPSGAFILGLLAT